MLKRTLFDYPAKRHHLFYSAKRNLHYRCANCGLMWHYKPGKKHKCLGAPTYFDKKHIQDHEKSFSDLASNNLTPAPGQQPVAYLRYDRSLAVLPLYDERCAVPLRPQ